MKTRIEHIETKIEYLETKVANTAVEVIEIKAVQLPMKLKLDKLHDKKGEDNNRLQVFSSMLEMFKENQDNFAESIKENQDNFAKNIRESQDNFAKNIRGEHDIFTQIFKEEMQKLSSNLSKLMGWQNKVIGGSVVLGAILSAILIIFKIWMEFYRG